MAIENKNDVLIEGVNDYIITVNKLFLWHYKEKSLGKYKGGNVAYFQRNTKAKHYEEISILEKEYNSIEKELEQKGYKKTNTEIIPPKISKPMILIYIVLFICLIISIVIAVTGFKIFIGYVVVILFIIIALYMLSVISKKHCSKIIKRQEEILNYIKQL